MRPLSIAWLVACALLGLASDRIRVPRFKILRARLNMEFKRARQHLAQGGNDRPWREMLETEYAEFLETVKAGGRELAKRLDTRYRELEFALKMQRKRLALLTAQLSV